MTLWRFGYFALGDMRQLGWRSLFWRFWWFSPALERELLVAYGRVLNVEPLPGESNSALRGRMRDQMMDIGIVNRADQRQAGL